MRARSLLVGLLAAAGAALGLAGPTAAAAPPAGGDVEPYIVGGHNATQTYSFMASLQSLSGGHFCGGSLIKSNWVVTAAHCVQGTSAGSIQVRVGSTQRSSGGSVARVSRVIVHPNYPVSNGPGDIALLQLSSSVSQTPVRISSEAGPAGTRTRIIGWGQTCPTRGGCGAPQTLQELDTSIVEDRACRSGFDGRTEICTNNPNRNSGACYGDSGGPQIKSVNGRWELVGATSRAGGATSTCAVDPSIYTDVTAYRSWIQQYTGAL
ncbi:Trypsin [Streptoalloteichus tenebrarius]|uniref:Trypsin n=1 Tax=Streptoalloteichus tenebrarius (strain ATCC 17920 / DSM 40477 / JCM 4838 / CBS 697.72 / NBRC 16177 / NCIMB 11028 / NRRL B-12390 / A12253. 1 / ISP 5477) TaxID=1933 RepID=A0ABT1HTS2_STRSD|nr:serine protease [Streptoalloteichus tenebrarius]MCP2258926.1 Trypsin [Streptoalloteichus tenebrarius]